MRATSNTFLNRFFKESTIDERVYTVTTPGGKSRFISTSTVIDCILDAPYEEQEKIANTLIYIGLRRGSIHFYLEELARAMVARYWFLSR
jgi:hypothetical protein